MRDNTQSKRLPAKISVIMPAFNEENTISQIVDKVLEQKIVKQLIIVDDNSSDATASIIRKKRDPRILLLQHSSNSGKGVCNKDCQRVCGPTDCFNSRCRLRI